MSGKPLCDQLVRLALARRTGQPTASVRRAAARTLFDFCACVIGDCDPGAPTWPPDRAGRIAVSAHLRDQDDLHLRSLTHPGGVHNGRTLRIGTPEATQHLGFVWRVKPGSADEYARRHKEIWPALRELLVVNGASSFSIYLHGELVFGHLETDDFPRLGKALADDPLALAWEAEFEDILEYPNTDPETGWPQRLTEVWSL